MKLAGIDDDFTIIYKLFLAHVEKLVISKFSEEIKF